MLSYNDSIETKEALKMQKFIDFLMFFGEYVLVVYLPTVLFVVVFTWIGLKLIKASLKCVDFIYEMKESIASSFKERMQISKQIRRFGGPLEVETFYPDGRKKTRKYYF